MSKSAVRKAANATAPTTKNGTVVPFPGERRVDAAPQDRGCEIVLEAEDQRPRRQYLTEREVEQLREAARKRGRYGHRDATMILLCYRHGLRVSELVALQWAQVDLEAGRLQVTRREGSDDSVQPLSGVEIRAGPTRDADQTGPF